MIEIEFQGRDSLSGEEALWVAVLETFIIDIKLWGRFGKYKMNSKRIYDLIQKAKQERTKEICEYIDIEHDWFVEQLENLAYELGYEVKH